MVKNKNKKGLQKYTIHKELKKKTRRNLTRIRKSYKDTFHTPEMGK